MSDYLRKAEERLKEEEDRVERYLHTTTRKLLISKCEHILVRTHAELMWDSFQSLLDYDKDQDLRRIYSLLSRIPEGLEPLLRKFEEHVKRTGLAAIATLVGSDATAIEELDPTAYVMLCLRSTLNILIPSAIVSGVKLASLRTLIGHVENLSIAML